jgi:hypothetical protein
MKICACDAGVLDRRWKNRWRRILPAGLMALGVAMTGCQNAPFHVALLQQSYRPDNKFVYPPKLSLNLQRVAVLPMAAETSSSDNLPEGCAALTPVLWDQLIKTKKFELVEVDPLRLRQGTGQAYWTGTETLPPDFFGFLRREYGCDGVLFAELTTYRAYAPLAVGWRLKLVDARSGQVVWSADEVFDAARPSVAHAVQRFTDPGFTWSLFYNTSWLAVNSPDQFGHYSAAALLNTLPDR